MKDWLDEYWFPSAFVLVVLGLLAGLTLAIVIDSQERAALYKQGCKVIDSKSETTFTLMSADGGKTQMLMPLTTVTELWRCPNGKEFLR